MTPALDAKGLNKRFGTVHAVKNLSLSLEPGTALGLLGSNGAGKSTTLSMLMGLRRPDTGSISVFGHRAGSPEARALVGATPQTAGFPDQLTPREVLAYAAARYDQPRVTDTVIETFGLAKLIDRRMAGFSGGEVRRVALALAFVGKPKLIFLDEPTSGLDSTSQDAFRVLAREYVQAGGALVLTSHHWDEIEAVCDRICLIDRGEQVLGGSLEDIRGSMQANRISFALPEGCPPPKGAVQDAGIWQLDCTNSDEAVRGLVRAGLPFSNLAVQPMDLKDIVETLRAAA